MDSSKRNKIILAKLKIYYGNNLIRSIIDVVYILNEILLALYLLYVPIQVAYYWKLRDPSNIPIQTAIDISVAVMFSVHILLYFDEKLLQIVKNPYAVWYKKIVTLELLYDAACVVMAICAAAITHKSIAERIIELLFFFKVVKLVKFDIKCMSVVVGTSGYTPYKVFRTLLIVFMAIAYVGSLFYGIAYYLYLTLDNTFEKNLLWIVQTGAIQDCVAQPFIIQLEYAMYWALGTASTAAYGDISAAQPTMVLINILALAFEGFLFGFYLNSMHSIPAENSQKEADLLQKFDSFQQHSSNRKLDSKLYLQILCSLEYSQSKKKSLDSIEKLMPKKYIQEIKYNMYSSFINEYVGRTFFDFYRFEVAEKIKETICEMGENAYNYSTIGFDSLVYIKEGKLNCYLDGELRLISQVVKESNTCIGVYQFLTGCMLSAKAVCVEYSSLYSISRQEYKQVLSKDEDKLVFYQRSMKALLNFQGQVLTAQPVIKYFYNLESNNSEVITFNQEKKANKVIKRLYEGGMDRQHSSRNPTKSNKLLPRRKGKRNFGTQTEAKEWLEIDQVYLWDRRRQLSILQG